MLANYADQIVGALLTGCGAVLTASLAWTWKRVNERWKRPRVVIEVGNGEGHVSETILIKTYSNGMSSSSTGREAIFVRAKVTNKAGGFGAPETARGCIGYLAGLEKWDPARGEFGPTKYHDFLRLSWSYNGEAHGMDLLPGVPVWLDVVYVLPPNQPMTPSSLKIASNPPVNRYSEGFYLPDLFRVKVQVSGENFRAQSVQFYVLVPNGSNTPEVLEESTWRARLPALESSTEDQIQQRLAPSDTRALPV
ncbi:MAG: hypothetical protein U0871_04500 [Gemmataceae bacterium]